MNVLYTETDLGKPVQDLSLFKILRLFLSLFNFRREVTLISVLHHNVQAHFGCAVDLLELDNVRVRQGLQNFGLAEGILLLLLAHVRHEDLFYYIVLIGFDLLD